MDDLIVKGIPESLRRYITEDCGISPESISIIPGDKLPQPAKQLLYHDRDMTSTLERFHKSQIFVDCIQRYEIEGEYFREVYLKTRDTEAVVEYGVIAIVLSSFTREQCREIESDYEPFGGLLHQFEIQFVSSPVCFFSIQAETLVDTPFSELPGLILFGRFNRLSKSDGTTLAWIMEILPESLSENN